jgi:hypothetical protein
MMVYDDGGSLMIRARAEGPNVIGDMIQEIVPGESFLGFTYDELIAFTMDGGGDGYVEVDS